MSKHADLPYRPGVGIMLFGPPGQVLVARRIDMPSDAWQMPQGGIDKGEDPEAAAYRELFEETGMQTVTLLGRSKGWINYDLPEHLIGIGLKGKYRGQTQAWFAFRFTGDEREIQIAPPPGGHTQEFDEWAWKPMQDLPGLIVPFKRAVYDQVVAEFSHLAGTEG